MGIVGCRIAGVFVLDGTEVEVPEWSGGAGGDDVGVLAKRGAERERRVRLVVMTV